MKFTVPLCPTLALWLVGDTYKNKGVPEFLNSIAHGWRLRRIYPTARLPPKVLDRAAKLVADPSREPSEEWIQNARRLRIDDLRQTQATRADKAQAARPARSGAARAPSGQAACSLACVALQGFHEKCNGAKCVCRRSQQSWPAHSTKTATPWILRLPRSTYLGCKVSSRPLLCRSRAF